MLHAPSTDLLHACSTKTLLRASPPAALTSLQTDGNSIKSPPADVLGSPPPRTKWTCRVPHPVLSGHAASLTPY